MSNSTPQDDHESHFENFKNTLVQRFDALKAEAIQDLRNLFHLTKPADTDSTSDDPAQDSTSVAVDGTKEVAPGVVVDSNNTVVSATPMTSTAPGAVPIPSPSVLGGVTQPVPAADRENAANSLNAAQAIVNAQQTGGAATDAAQSDAAGYTPSPIAASGAAAPVAGGSVDGWSFVGVDETGLNSQSASPVAGTEQSSPPPPPVGSVESGENTPAVPENSGEHSAQAMPPKVSLYANDQTRVIFASSAEQVFPCRAILVSDVDSLKKEGYTVDVSATDSGLLPTT